MTTVLDNQDSPRSKHQKRHWFTTLVYIYAALLTLLLIFFLGGLHIKTSPTSINTDDPLEIQEHFSRFAGICINVGECGNNQVVIGLEENQVSKQLYNFLVWKSSGSE